MVGRRASGKVGRLAAWGRCREFAAARRRKGNPAFPKRLAAAPALRESPAASSRCEGRAAARRFPERTIRRDGSRATGARVWARRCRTPDRGHRTASVHERPATRDTPCGCRREAAPPGAVDSTQPAFVQRGLGGDRERVARARGRCSAGAGRPRGRCVGKPTRPIAGARGASPWQPGVEAPSGEGEGRADYAGAVTGDALGYVPCGAPPSEARPSPSPDGAGTSHASRSLAYLRNT